MADLGEFGLIDRLARTLQGDATDPLRPSSRGEIRIGDDAALWQPTPGASEVLTTDALVEDVHFRLRTTSWQDLGWKALAQNVSDVAAMGAKPRRAFITLGLRGDTPVADLEALYGGMGELAEQYGVAIVGGDTVASPVILISVSVVGELTGDGLRRSAGREGDLLAVTGALGGSRAGLEILEAGGPAPDDPDALALATVHRRPIPRVAEGLVLTAAGVPCGMDLSDGLLGDAGKLAYASGLAATLRWDALPLHPVLARRSGEDGRATALVGGEDFELLVAGPNEAIERAATTLARGGLAPLTVVGALHRGPSGQVRVVDADGTPRSTPGTSWDHFASREGGT
ncbi:MAG: thiamine-phosphate kinase [Chloroflexota bacterium]|nr:thiamine-phosphate kinase [Chloroflexota bacterium]